MRRAILSFILILVLSSLAVAASVYRSVLIDESVSATGTSKIVCFPRGTTDFSWGLDVTNTSGSTPTLDLAIQYSPDCTPDLLPCSGVSWLDLETFAQVETTATYSSVSTAPATGGIPGGCARASYTLGGTSPVYDLKVVANYDYRY